MNKAMLRFEGGTLMDSALFRRVLNYAILIVLLGLLISCEKFHQERLNKDLVSAASYGDSQHVESLLKKGADVDARNKHGETALMRAADIDSIDTIRILLENGTNVHLKNGSGCTALMYAVAPNARQDPAYLEVAQLLIDKGADVNAQTNDGATALVALAGSTYCKWGPTDLKDSMAQLLIANGADVNAMTGDGCRALDLANSPTLREILIDAGAVEGEECHPGIC